LGLSFSCRHGILLFSFYACSFEPGCKKPGGKYDRSIEKREEWENNPDVPIARIIPAQPDATSLEATAKESAHTSTTLCCAQPSSSLKAKVYVERETSYKHLPLR